MAAKKKPAINEPDQAPQELIAVTKNGETIHVCPEQVEQHRRLGWSTSGGNG